MMMVIREAHESGLEVILRIIRYIGHCLMTRKHKEVVDEITFALIVN